ncbi:hypothetical protein [Lysinibacillus sp. NPDC047702]|uniref:hypothetical protein n=1 Tax=unclassified Lysinibacillus TaxID=2636778 RepID=UPI003CFFE9FF
MEFIIVSVVMILLVGFLINLKKAKRSNVSSRSRSSHTGTGTTDYISMGSVFTLQDNDNHNNHCSDNTSNYSDSSDGGSSCD